MAVAKGAGGQVIQRTGNQDLRRLMVYTDWMGGAFLNPPATAALHFAAKHGFELLSHGRADRMSKERAFDQNFELVPGLKESAEGMGIHLSGNRMGRIMALTNLLVAYPGAGRAFRDSSDGDYFVMPASGGTSPRMKLPREIMALKDHVVCAVQGFDSAGRPTIHVEPEFKDEVIHIPDPSILKAVPFPTHNGWYLFNLKEGVPKDTVPFVSMEEEPGQEIRFLVRSDAPTITLVARGHDNWRYVVMDIHPDASEQFCLVTLREK